MGKVEDIEGVVTQVGWGLAKNFGPHSAAKNLLPWGWGQGRGVKKNFFGQGGTLLIKVGQYFFTGVVILEKMAPQGG